MPAADQRAPGLKKLKLNSIIKLQQKLNPSKFVSLQHWHCISELPVHVTFATNIVTTTFTLSTTVARKLLAC